MREEHNNTMTRLQQPDMNKLCNELRFTRMVCIITSVLTVFLLIGGGYLLYSTKQFAKEAEPVIEQFSALDVESLNQTLEQLNDTMESVDWEQFAQTIEKLDVEALNEAIENLDTQELTEALANLNAAAESLRSFNEKLTSFFR